MTIVLDFPTDYEIEESELPGTGNDVLYFKKSDLAAPGATGGLVLKLTPVGKPCWFGVFGQGVRTRDALQDTVHATANPQVACICVSGAGYWVNVHQRTKQDIVVFPVMHVVAVRSASTILLHDFTSVCAYGKNGLLWLYKESGIDRLSIDHIEGDAVHCSALRPDSGKRCLYVVDLQTGKRLT